MGEKKRIELRAVSNVAASKVALIDVPVGDRYHQITFQHGYSGGTNTIAAAAANITLVEVLVNNRVQRSYTGQELRDANLLHGTNYDAVSGEVPNTAPGVSFTIFFAEPWRKDARDQDFLAWVTRGFKSFQIRITLGAASTPTLVAYAVTDDFVPSGPVGYVTIDRQQAAAGGTAFDVNNIDRKGLLQQISVYPDSGATRTPSRVTLRKNGDVKHELTMEANKKLLLDNTMTPAASGRTSNVYDVVCDHDDILNSGIDLTDARTFSMRIEAASAMSGSTTFLVYRWGALL